MVEIQRLQQQVVLIPQIAQLGYADWGYQTPEPVIDFLHSTLVAAVPCTAVAMHANQLAGSISLLEHEMGTQQPAERRYWLGFLVVDPRFRGQGIGRKLMAYMQQHAMQLGIEQVYCYTIHQADLYQFLGWTSVEQCQYQGDWVTVMTKRLVSLSRRLDDVDF
ncbi:MAG: GNAT family N-acetyltransferase [Pseudomonadota bacterium]|nr:GNAT family N-acetyltransferase [Pseudomonadota bacterium]